MSMCRNFHEYMREQERRLREAIDENKWYLSERAGYDVGYAAAEMDFAIHHLDRFAHEFRVEFCGTRCSARWECALARRAARLAGSRELHRRFQGRPFGDAAAAY